MDTTVIGSSEFIKVFSNGSVERFTPITAPASLDLYNGYKCKDVTIDPLNQIIARIFIPTTTTIATMLPVLVYFHGGGFCIGSTTWLGYHHFLGDLSASSETIVVSVDYRLAPEHKLPVAYDDCYTCLVWLSQQKQSESWLQNADLSRVFLSGDSAGGNIAHQLATRAIRDKGCPLRISGILPIHPYFGSEKRTDLEMKEGSSEEVKSNDMFWRLSIPEGSNRDYEGCNLERMEMSISEWSQFPKVLIFVAELDFLRERGVTYAEFLKKKGVKEVKLIRPKMKNMFFMPSAPFLSRLACYRSK